jgi:signal transduction histidine kinase
MQNIEQMGAPRSKRAQIGLVVGVVALTLAFHYGFILPPQGRTASLFHAVHGRLCYIPIILSALWFGLRGGLATAVAIILLTLPYTRQQALRSPELLAGEVTEMIFYVAIALTAGTLVELQQRERRRSEALERELARQRHLSSLGQMAAGLAHEIKNPLGAIQGAAEVLADDFPPGHRKREMLEVVAKESRRLARVVEDFLAFARPRSPDRHPTDVNRLVQEALAQMREQARARGVRFEHRLDPSLPSVPLDRDQIHQVLLNLILNALEAMPEGGTVAVVTEPARIEDRPAVAIRVADTGEGIERADLERIFDPFYTTRPKGTGLGLSISHSILRSHAGTLDVESAKGRGTTVTLRIPLDVPEGSDP